MKNIIVTIVLALTLGGCVIYKSTPSYTRWFALAPVPPTVPVTVYVPAPPSTYYIVPSVPQRGMHQRPHNSGHGMHPR